MSAKILNEVSIGELPLLYIVSRSGRHCVSVMRKETMKDYILKEKLVLCQKKKREFFGFTILYSIKTSKKKVHPLCQMSDDENKRKKFMEI